MKKWTVRSIETVEWVWEEIEAETEDEAVVIAMENWTTGTAVENTVEEMYAEEETQ